jgi:hypothetical protein
MHTFALSDPRPHIVVSFLELKLSIKGCHIRFLGVEVSLDYRTLNPLKPVHTAHNHFLSGYLPVEKIY